VAQVIHRSQESIVGPWLFDQAVMDSLDDVIEEQWSQLQTNKKRLIENAVKREKYQAEKDGKYENLTPEQVKELDKRIRKEAESDPTYGEDNCIFTLTLSSGHKLKDSTLKGAAEHSECQNQHVRKLEVSMVCGGIKVSLVVPSADNKNDLQIVTLPEGSEQAKEAFVKLTIWAENNKPRWLRIMNGLPPPLIIPIFAILLLPFVFAASFMRANPKPSLRDEARDLVQKGITPAEHDKALTILLRRGYEPERADMGLDEVPFWFWVVIAVWGTLTILLSMTATTAFEVGKGKRTVRWQKWHGNLLRKWVPGQ
jgi:hypothetical protein